MSTDEQHPDLFSLLRGELGNAQVAAAGDHLDGCDLCRHELAELAVGHALLTGTTRTLSERHLVTMPEVPELVRPTRSSRWLRPIGLVAAAAVLVAGSVGLTRWVDRDVEAPPVTTAEQSADLEPVVGTGSGRVVMAADGPDEVTMTVETHDLPAIHRGQFYYVWLFNPDTGKMLPLGVIGPQGQASFEVPDDLVGRYQVVDVSLERDDGDPAHSVTSVLRAAYA